MNESKYKTADNLKFIVSNVWEWSKKNFFLIILQIPLSILLPYLYTYNMKMVIDCLVVRNQYVYTYVCVLFILVCVVAAINKYSEKYIEWVLRGYRYTYINSISKKRMKTDYNNIISSKGQELLGRALNMVSHDEATTQAIVISLLGSCSSLFGVLIYSIIIVQFNSLVLVLVLLTALINFYFVKKIREYEYSVRKYTGPLDRKMAYITARTGDFSNAKDIRVFAMSRFLKTLFDIFSYERMEWHKKILKNEYRGMVVSAILVLIRDSIGYAFLIYQFYLGTLSIGNFTYYIGIIAGLSTWITSFLYNYNDILKQSYDISDLRSYLDMPEEGEILEKKYLELKNIDEIELKKVSFRFNEGEQYVIKDISLKIKKGDKIAIVGLNGAGKTTLVSLICGLLKPTEGEIFYNGISGKYYRKEEVFNNFAAVFQDIGILPLSIKQNITLNEDDQCNNDKLNDVLDKSGMIQVLTKRKKSIDSLLVKEVNEEAVQLSGGELQKIALARAMYKDSSVMILDEPTAALDPITEADIYNKYDLFFGKKISFYISHRLASTQFCDKIILLEKGEIIEKGTHVQLLNKRGRYFELFNTQSKYYED